MWLPSNITLSLLSAGCGSAAGGGGSVKLRQQCQPASQGGWC